MERPATLGLRQRVLRPHQSLADLAAEDAAGPPAVAFAALAGDEVVATGSVTEEAPSWAGGPAWRLRAMASDESYRGTGAGGAVLLGIIDFVAASGGGLLWCHARMPAVGFYRRFGFTTRGEQWDEPFIGPHVMMERLVEPAGAASS